MSDIERTTTDELAAFVTINRPERRNPGWGPL